MLNLTTRVLVKFCHVSLSSLNDPRCGPLIRLEKLKRNIVVPMSCTWCVNSATKDTDRFRTFLNFAAFAKHDSCFQLDCVYLRNRQ